MYLFDGIVSLHCKNKSGCALKDVTIGASCRMLYGDDSSESVISSVSQSLDHDSTLFGRTVSLGIGSLPKGNPFQRGSLGNYRFILWKTSVSCLHDHSIGGTGIRNS